MADEEGREEPRPGCYERAWNDPPLFSYASSSGATSKPAGNRLNRRVAFPGGGPHAVGPPPVAPAGATPPPIPGTALHDAGARPTPASAPPPPPSTAVQPSAASTNPKPSQDEKIDVDAVLSELKVALADSGLDARRKADVGKRLDVMATTWRAGGLNAQVKQRLYQVSKGLAPGGDVGAADRAQLSIGVDWPDLCGTWHVGLRHLVASARTAVTATEGGGQGSSAGAKGISAPFPNAAKDD